MHLPFTTHHKVLLVLVLYVIPSSSLLTLRLSYLIPYAKFFPLASLISCTPYSSLLICHSFLPLIPHCLPTPHFIQGAKTGEVLLNVELVPMAAYQSMVMQQQQGEQMLCVDLIREASLVNYN
jgi:hypothetical protein